VHELAADLAAGITSSGSWAVLIDADYGNPSDLPEFSTAGLELEEVVGDPRKLLGEAFDRTDREKELVGVSIRNRDPDAADLLAQPAFANMLDVAQELNDVVIVACPPTDSASYHVLSQRLDAMVLVAVPGDLVPADVVNALHTLDERRAHAAGVVLVQPRVGPISLITRGLEQTASRPAQGGNLEPDWHWSVEADRLGDPPEYPPLAPKEPRQDVEPSTAGAREEQEAPTRTARITRRATALKAASATTPLKKPHASASPWSFRHGGEDAAGDGDGDRPTD
jgi:Mrp family chromosome partitioning ATPase